MFFLRAKNFFKLTRLSVCQFFRKISGRKIIHVIGDSHTLAFQDCAIKVHYLGAVTAYNLLKEESSSGGRKKMFDELNTLKPGDQVLLVFGEIDCRIHVYNQYMKKLEKISMNQLIDNVVLNYSKVIDEIKKRGINVSIYNIVPPGPQKNIYSYPFYADWKTRLWITEEMNKKIKELCIRNDLFFVDIFDLVINQKSKSEKDFRDSNYVFDDVHLNDRITGLVIEKFRAQGLI